MYDVSFIRTRTERNKFPEHYRHLISLLICSRNGFVYILDEIGSAFLSFLLRSNDKYSFRGNLDGGNDERAWQTERGALKLIRLVDEAVTVFILSLYIYPVFITQKGRRGYFKKYTSLSLSIRPGELNEEEISTRSPQQRTQTWSCTAQRQKFVRNARLVRRPRHVCTYVLWEWGIQVPTVFDHH